MHRGLWHPRHFFISVAPTLLVGVLICGSPCCLEAQQKHLPGDGLAVDLVTLKSGRSLRGAITSQQPNGSLTMAVSQNWLTSANSMLATTALKENLEGRRAGWKQAYDRIGEHLKTPIDSPHLTFFFKQERERLKPLMDDRNEPETDFLWVEVRQEMIAKVKQAGPDQRRIGAFAWSERLAHVETRESSALQKELTGRGVNLDAPLPDLLDRLPARRQSDEEWKVRLALVEYALAKPLDFQGMGDTLARVRQDQPADLSEILPKLLQQQLGSLLKDFASEGLPQGKNNNDTRWMAGAIRLAEREGVRGFRVTRLELDAAAARVTVETRFVAQIVAGNWKTIWMARESGDGTKARPQMEARIEQDPQLKSAIGTLNSFGLGDPQTLKQAIRVGAATMSTQQAADAAFAEFRDRYTRHLDGPPLSLIGGP